ncbi:chemotaxis protein CheW [mine drainage metagenome]|uniref:Chemotaxis protein CheW n=1 Tax=mine drainage metagenome TaxID=410659 RepID=A0A1J5S7Y3_9ZZZZ
MATTSGRQFITFTIGAEEYGFDVMAIREIKGWTTVTELPEMPASMRGVINLRGVIVPVFDLRARFSGLQTEPTPRHVVVVMAVQGRLLGILVDAVVDILSVQPDEIRPVPALDQSQNHYLQGIVITAGRMVTLLELDDLFDSHSLAAAHSVGATAA